MKILWFSNTPCAGIYQLNENFKLKRTGGWLESLNIAIENELELAISFPFARKIDKFKHNKTLYFPIFEGNLFLKILKLKIFKKTFENLILKSALEVINEYNPEIIHIHGTENDFLELHKYTKIPIVVSIQGNYIVYHHKYLTGFGYKYLNTLPFNLNFSSILSLLFNFKYSYNYFKINSKREQKNMLLIKNVIGRTSWDKRLTSILAPNSNYFYGAEILRDKFYNSKWNNPYYSGKVFIFTINSDSYFKGIETVFHSISLLLDLGMDIEWKIAGLNEHSLIYKISKKKLGKIFPSRGFKLLGPLDEISLVQEMLQSNLYVMPSHIENSPNNLCEAMMLGLPCISTFVGGTNSLIIDLHNGILVQDGDPWSMSGAILDVIGNRELQLKLSKNARKDALLRHDKSAIVKQYVNIYNQILKNN